MSFVSSRPSLQFATNSFVRQERHFCLVRVGGVNTIANKRRQFCLVSNCVHTTDVDMDKTRQFCHSCKRRRCEQAITRDIAVLCYDFVTVRSSWVSFAVLRQSFLVLLEVLCGPVRSFAVFSMVTCVYCDGIYILGLCCCCRNGFR